MPKEQLYKVVATFPPVGDLEAYTAEGDPLPRDAALDDFDEESTTPIPASGAPLYGAHTGCRLKVVAA